MKNRNHTNPGNHGVPGKHIPNAHIPGIPTKEYIAFIRRTIASDGFEIAGDVNHRALDAGLIPLPVFLTAAQIIAQVIIDR